MRFAIEPKPNEPRGDILLPTVGHALAFITTLEHPEMVGLNPEVGHEQMAGLNFAARHRPGAVARQAVPHRPQRPARHQVRPGPRLRPRRPAQRVLPGRPAGERRPDGGRPTTARGTSTTSRSRTEDIDGVWASAAANMRTYLLLKERAAAFRADPRGAGGARRRRGRRARDADARRRRDRTPTCSPTARAFEDFDADAAARGAASASSSCNQLAARAPARRALTGALSAARSPGSTRRPSPCKVVVRDADTGDAGPPGARPAPGRHRGRPGRLVGRAAAPRSRRPAGSTTSTAIARRRPAARHGVPRRGGRGRPARAAVERHALGAGRRRPGRRARRAGVGRRRRAACRSPRSPSPSCAGSPSTSRTTPRATAAVCLPHDWLTWRLRGGLGTPATLADLITDRSDASGTGYWSPAHRRLPARPAGAGARRSDVALPRVLGPGEAAGRAATGGMVLGPGTGDNAAAALGLGARAGRRRRLDRHLRGRCSR